MKHLLHQNTHPQSNSHGEGVKIVVSLSSLHIYLSPIEELSNKLYFGNEK
ncbi:hypothetical protein EMIT079MI2_20342 [Bacillus sp. IT-79MI2]